MEGIWSSVVGACQEEAFDVSSGGGGNCARSPVSVSVCEDNTLRISTLSLAAPQQRDPGTVLHDLAAVDGRLARLRAAWTSLPEHIILAILALVDSTGVWRQNASKPRAETLPASTAAGRPPNRPGSTATVRRRPFRPSDWRHAGSTSRGADDVRGRCRLVAPAATEIAQSAGRATADADHRDGIRGSTPPVSSRLARRPEFLGRVEQSLLPGGGPDDGQPSQMAACMAGDDDDDRPARRLEPAEAWRLALGRLVESLLAERKADVAPDLRGSAIAVTTGSPTNRNRPTMRPFITGVA